MDATAYLARWEALHEKELEALRTTPVEVKFKQLAALMASAHAFGPREQRQNDEQEVRERWNTLRRRYGV